MSCLKREIFVNKEDLASALCCSLGKGVLNTPVTLPCGHSFCESCIKQSILSLAHCPDCKAVHNGKHEANPKLQERIGNLEVFCAHRHLSSDAEPAKEKAPIEDLGCAWHGKLRDLAVHLTEQCNYAEVACRNPGCTFRGNRPALAQHTVSCMYRIVKCEWCGRADIAFLEKKGHDDSCEEKSISCALDCGMEMKRKQYEVHRRKDCPNNYTNIHVKGFASTVTEAELEELFKPFGEIVHLKLVEANTKSNKFPYCFVCYRTPEAAHSAQSALNESSWKKRTIYVAKAATPRHIWSEYRKKYPACCVYIRNLPPEVSDDELAKTFSDVGFVFATHIVMIQQEDPAVKISKGTAYVCFSMPLEADTAVEQYKDKVLFGQQLAVTKYVPEEERKVKQSYSGEGAAGYYPGYSGYNSRPRRYKPQQQQYEAYPSAPYPQYVPSPDYPPPYMSYYQPPMSVPAPSYFAPDAKTVLQHLTRASIWTNSLGGRLHWTPITQDT